MTLRPPFDGQTAAELIDQIGRRRPGAAAEDRADGCRATWRRSCSRRWPSGPTDRYATAAELAEDLARFLSHEPVKARRIGPVGRLWRVARRHPGITAVSTTAAAIVLAVATFAYVILVSERNSAYAERDQKLAALDELRAARKNELRSMIEVVGLSGNPIRRSHGLDLIKQAARLEPEAQYRTELRAGRSSSWFSRRSKPASPS